MGRGGESGEKNKGDEVEVELEELRKEINRKYQVAENEKIEKSDQNRASTSLKERGEGELERLRMEFAKEYKNEGIGEKLGRPREFLEGPKSPRNKRRREFDRR